MDVSQYLEIFIDETKEHLQSLNEQLLVIEKEPENTDTINEIFRAAHSLKGMAGTMGYKRMQKLTHQMENVFSEIRNGAKKVDANIVDVLFQCLDALEEYLACIQETADEGDNDNEPILKQLETILNGSAPKAQTEASKETAKEPQKAEAEEAKEKYKDFVYADFEKHAIAEAFEKGINVYTITVFVDENCLLKAARAFLVFKSVEGVGEIIKSNPSAQDIEDEKFEFDFSICVVSKEPLEAVLSVIKNVSEIADAIGEKLESIPGDGKTEEGENKETRPAEDEKKPAVAAAAKAAPAKSQTSKPIVNRSVRVDIEKLDVLMNLVSELIIAKNGLVSQSSSEEVSQSQAFNEQIEYLERVTTNLHESVMKVRMMPIETVTQKFPRMIRDLSKKLNKKMELYMTGEDTELDRTVIDEIGDPLMHLLRNSADHGLESAEIRARRGKPEVGTVCLDAYQDGNNVVIEVRDDGNGIDVEAVKNKALDKGSITPEQAAAMSDKEIIDLLFKPSFSTAKVVSDISGRGVGLDVVKTKIEALGGDIEVKTELGVGSTFIIRLPLTLAIIQALMVELGDEKYAISLGSIQIIEDIPVSDIKYVQTKEVVNLRGSVIPIIRLDEVLDIESSNEEETLTVVIVKKGDRLAGLVVDKLIGQQEIVIKSLGKYISNSKIINGATILGDGEVALILDVNTLL
ncbi:MAG: chemotaxis protein CheA [Lachnospiraceae bacterium]|nr:chemotaxis protein CheA [Lachnospiraceae bacterium]